MDRRERVHRNTMMAGLARALAEGFPSIERLVGAEFFAAIAVEHVREQPPRNPVLLAYGEGFADFLDRFPPVALLPWLGDVARLDGLRRRAWHAADVTALAVDSLLGVDPDTAARWRVALHPSVSLLASEFPARTLWAAQNGDEHGDALIWEGERVLVWRREMTLRVERIDAPLVALLDRARHRPTLGELLAPDAGTPPAYTADAFAFALRNGLLVDADALDLAHAHAADAALFDGFLPPFPPRSTTGLHA